VYVPVTVAGATVTLPPTKMVCAVPPKVNAAVESVGVTLRLFGPLTMTIGLVTDTVAGAPLSPAAVNSPAAAPTPAVWPVAAAATVYRVDPVGSSIVPKSRSLVLVITIAWRMTIDVEKVWVAAEAIPPPSSKAKAKIR